VLGTVCKSLLQQQWDSAEVWQALSVACGLPKTAIIGVSPCSSCAGRDARETFRRAAFRTDIAQLRSLAMVGRPHDILGEAAHVACGLLPGDLSTRGLAEFIKIATRSLGAHDPESTSAILDAERLLRASRRCMELFTEEQLEHLEYAYKSVHQLHELMLASMRDAHEDWLQQSFWGDPIAPDDNEDFKAMFGAVQW
jgi:hypothetical protein